MTRADIVHMATTERRPDGTYYWYCRCGKAGRGFSDVQFARNAGDRHLAKANG